MIKTKGFSDWNTGKEIRVVWRNFSTLQRRNTLKFDKRRTILHQAQYIIIFDFFYADHSILKLGIATQHNILNFVLVAIQQASKNLFGRGNTELYKISNNIKLPAKTQNDKLPTTDKVELGSTLSRRRKIHFFSSRCRLKPIVIALVRSVCFEHRNNVSLSR